MAWQLDIHLIDIGQGDCTLILAHDLGPPGPPQFRTMLIDGGLGQCARTVHTYVAGQLAAAAAAAGVGVPVPPLDQMVCTHYERDHGLGLLGILRADDLSQIVRTLTTAGSTNAIGANRPQQIASVAAAVCSAAKGCYGANAGLANTAALNARNDTAVGDSDQVAAGNGVWQGEQTRQPPAGSRRLIDFDNTRKRVSTAAGVAAANTLALIPLPAPAVVTASIQAAIFNTFAPGIDQNARFLTNNLYNNTNVIDLGYQEEIFRGWVNAINGGFLHGDHTAQSPQGRNRTSLPALGAEVLWGAGAAPMIPPALAPMAHVVSRDTLVWQGVGMPSYQVATGNPGNDSSIGLVIRFNNFFYLTAGDLPWQGEDRIAAAVMATGLPDPAAPAGPVMAVPNTIASFKVGHHGSVTSTSPAFLAAINPASALISCGYNDSYLHPDQPVITMLANPLGPPLRFYLTNCIYVRVGVPGSLGPRPAQMAAAGNKSRVAGDNDFDNMAAWRVARGNIRLSVTQAASIVPFGAPRQHSVTFFNDDPPPPAAAPVTEHINF
jgi:beta-lactamase superfamily II metal-dependent hydrolase